MVDKFTSGGALDLRYDQCGNPELALVGCLESESSYSSTNQTHGLSPFSVRPGRSAMGSTKSMYSLLLPQDCLLCLQHAYRHGEAVLAIHTSAGHVLSLTTDTHVDSNCIPVHAHVSRCATSTTLTVTSYCRSKIAHSHCS